MTRANHVFHFDRWWNPAVEDQATDRALTGLEGSHFLTDGFDDTGRLVAENQRIVVDAREMPGNQFPVRR